MDRLSNTGVAHRNFPLHRPADEPDTDTSDKTEMAQPDHPVGERACVTASLPESPAPEGGTHPSLPGNNTTAVLSRAQNLPLVVLEKICSYLPFSDQSHCAQVCRHWHDCLPAPGLRLAQWLQKNAPLSCQAGVTPGRDFTSRALPFLQAVGSPVLPALMHLHKEAHLQQDTQQHQTPQLSDAHQDAHQALQPAAADLFPCLVHQALNQQLAQDNGFTLRPHAIDWPDSTLVGGLAFSPCSRWLALSCRLHVSAPAYLRLYSWGPDNWQQCSLNPPVLEPVSAFIFTSMPPDTLFSAHGTDVLAWRREPGTDDWHRTHVCRVPCLFQVCDLLPMDNGDLVTLAQQKQETSALIRVIFAAFLGNARGWRAVNIWNFPFTCPKGTRHRRLPFEWAGERRSSQLALGMVTQRPAPDYCINNVLIWRKGLNTASPHKWGYQASILAWHQADMARLTWSPGGHYLLGTLYDGRMCLWTQDAQCRLQEQLTLTGHPTPFPYRLKTMPLFCGRSQQLALPLSRHQVQLYYRDDSDCWQQGQRLETEPDPDIPPDDTLEYMQLSSSGRTLVRATRWCIDIWYRHPAHGWQHLVQRKSQDNAAFMPHACLLEPFDIVCSTAEDPHLSLWIHGVDTQGQLVRKACLAVDTSINGPFSVSPDGMSLLLGSLDYPSTFLQLSPQTTDDKTRPQTSAGPRSSSAARTDQRPGRCTVS
ncbi:MAG: F-box-like domain-containing protein [Kistimonas sp.]|nr:F-box-like domain-containing protein [Kistimonas sp.]